jgi:hypothetical protein
MLDLQFVVCVVESAFRQADLTPSPLPRPNAMSGRLDHRSVVISDKSNTT